MAYETDIRGYEQSGGWRFPYTGRQSSSEAFYGNAPRLDPQRLAALANGVPPQGLLDQALTQPAQQAQGLLTGYEGGGGRDPQGVDSVGSAPGTHSGTNALTGSGAGFAGKAAGAVIGGLLGGVPGAQLGMKAADFLGNFAGNFGTPGVENAYGSLSGGFSEATGPGTIGSRDTYGSNEGMGTDPYGVDAVSGHDAMSDAFSGGVGGFGGGDIGGDMGGDNTGGGGAMGGDRGDSGFAKGGHVQKQSLFGPDPKGKDDGYAALDAGEFVLKADAVKRIGAKALKALNEGRAKIVMIKKEA